MPDPTDRFNGLGYSINLSGTPRRRERPVLDPTGTRYPSLTAASRATGNPVSTICTWLLRGDRSGWRYADETLSPAAASSHAPSAA